MTPSADPTEVSAGFTWTRATGTRAWPPSVIRSFPTRRSTPLRSSRPTRHTLLLTELRQLGGALGRPDASGRRPLPHRADFAMFGVGLPMTPELGEAIEAQLNRFDDRCGPGREGGYFNFASAPATPTRSSRRGLRPPAEVKRPLRPNDRISPTTRWRSHRLEIRLTETRRVKWIKLSSRPTLDPPSGPRLPSWHLKPSTTEPRIGLTSRRLRSRRGDIMTAAATNLRARRRDDQRWSAGS